MSTYTSPDNKTAGLHRRLLWPVVILAGTLALGYAQEAQPLPVQPPQPPTPPEELLDLYEDTMELEALEQAEEAQRQAEEARKQLQRALEQLEQLEDIPQDKLDAARQSLQDAIRNTTPQMYIRVNEITQAYQDAYGHILDEKWAQARQAFEEFLKRYGEQRGNRYVDDARFWICFAMEKSKLPDEEVFEAYHQFIQEFTSSNWLDDAKANLIKIGRRLSAKSKKTKAEYGPIVAELEQDHNVEVAIAALNRMREFDNKSSVQAVFKLYDRTENGELRKKIVNALRNFEDPNVVARLSDIATKDPDGEVRKEAIGVLRRQGSEAAIKALVNVAANLDDPSERRNVVNALGRTSSDAVVPVLLNLAINDPHVRVRTEAVSALARIGTPEAQEALIKIMEGK